MKKVVINVPEGSDPGDVALLVRDALSDFVRVRTGGEGAFGVERYVRERYPEWGKPRQQAKVEQVCGRVRMALQLLVTPDDGTPPKHTDHVTEAEGRAIDALRRLHPEASNRDLLAVVVALDECAYAYLQRAGDK